MQNILTSLIYVLGAELGSVSSRVYNFLAMGSSYALIVLKNFGLWVLNLILQLIWIIEKFVLGVMEALEFVINEFLGIGTSVDELLEFGSKSDLSSTLIKTFRAIFGVAIVLIIIFTIIALIRQEYANISNDGGMNGDKNKPGPLVLKLFRGIMTMILLPFAMIVIIGAVNAVLTSFNNALKGDNQNATVAGQVLAVSTYDTNRYRMYANSNKRVPVIIEAYNTEDYKADELDKLVTKIQSLSIQTKLINTATNIEKGLLLSFNDTLTYNNNKISNSSTYGDYYESFICTAEQYQVMADFVDYCQLTNTNFYIKSIDDTDIEWKYVDSSVFDINNNSLTISYRDANDLDGDGSTSDTYTVVYTTGYDVTSPISDALNTISALLGLNDYSDMVYNEMERQQDSINVVRWANEKVAIHFSKEFNINNMSTWSVADEILMYEYYHFSANNTLADFTLNELSYDNKDTVNATLDAYKIVYREYFADADAYSKEREIYCVLINGSYYRVVKSETELDEYGNSMYVLMENSDVHFLESNYTVLARQDNEQATLVLTGKEGKAFDLNDVSTWSYTDQIIVYEFYKDLSVNNSLNSYTIGDFKTGVTLPVYHITDYTDINNTAAGSTTKRYVLLNGTYYEVTAPSGSGSNYVLKGSDNSSSFLELVTSSSYSSFYNYTGSTTGEILLSNTGSNYGISTTESNYTADSFIFDTTDGEEFDNLHSGIDFIVSAGSSENVSSLSLKFSSSFDYQDVETWTFRDYFLFYVYCKYLTNSDLTLDSLKYSALDGRVGTYRGEQYFRIDLKLTEDNIEQKIVYIKVSDVNMISTEKLVSALNYESAYENNRFETQDDLIFVNIADPSTRFSTSETEYKTFMFTPGISYSNVKEWAVRDYILFLLDSMGVISVDDTATYSYSSLCYKTTTSSAINSGNLYAFGIGDNRVYLNENYILGLEYKNLDAWLDTNLLSYISTKLNSNAYRDVILEESTLISSIVDSDKYSGNIYSFDTLLESLIQEYGLDISSSSSAFEVYSDIARYKYSNENFVFGNPLTWTIFDLATYAFTGSANGTYSGYVAVSDGTRRYVIGNYAISIANGSKLEATLNQTATISSQAINLDGGSLADYYNNAGLSNKVITVGISENKFYRADNFNYTYSGDENTAFTAILAGLGLPNTETYKLYTDETNKYILLGADLANLYFIKVDDFGIDQTAIISSNATITPTATSIFNESDGITAFDGSGAYTKFDAVVYNITNSKDQTVYKTYQIGDLTPKYAYVGNQYIEVSGCNYSLSDISSGVNSAKLESAADILAKNYYANYLVGNLGATTGNTISTYDLKFDINDVSTWTPIGLILYSSDITSALNPEITGTVVTSTSGAKSYFTLTAKISSGADVTINIDITNLAGVVSHGMEFEVVEKDEMIDSFKLLLTLICAKENDGTFNFVSTNEAMNRVSTLQSNAANYLSDSVITNYSTNIMENIGTVSETEFSNWNWLDLICNYVFGDFRDRNEFVIYSDINHNNSYVGLVYDGKTIFVKFSDSILGNDKKLVKFSSGIENNVSFSLDSAENSLIGLLYYKYTGFDHGNVNYVTIGSLDENTPIRAYFIYDAQTDTYIYVYYKQAENISFGLSTSEYSYELLATTQNLSSWNLFDLALKAADGNTTTQKRTFDSKIYTFNGVRYFKTNGYYIDLSLLNVVIPADQNPAATNKILIANTSSVLATSTFGFNSSNITANSNSSALNNSSFVKISSDLILEVEIENDDEDIVTKLYFSEGFDLSDYYSWKSSDFIIYYLFKTGHMDKSITNFQYYVNQGYVEVSTLYLELFDEYGSVEIQKVYKVGTSQTEFGSFGTMIGYDSISDYVNAASDEDLYLFMQSIMDYKFINAKLWQMQYNSSLGTVPISQRTNVDIAIENNASAPITSQEYTSFSYTIIRKDESKDFEYSNFYYFLLNRDSIIYEELNNGTSAAIYAITGGTYTNREYLNLKLSENFDISDVSTWTVLDYIVVYNFSRTDYNNTAFINTTFDELTMDRYTYLYTVTTGSGDQKFIKVNSYYYNVTNFLNGEKSFTKQVDEKSTTETTSDFVLSSNILDEYNYEFRVNAATYNFRLSQSASEISRELVKSSGTLAFNVSGDNGTSRTYYRDIDTNVERTYKISLTELDTYTISPVVKQVNWVQKLMTDMQVIYPDLNWANLIATDGWIGTLGDYHSAYASGIYVGSGNSANITAYGMVLSEFLLSIANSSVAGYANYEYSSVFGSDTIKSLMLSMLGEEQYEIVKMQADIYVEMFNIAFAKVLDDVATERGINIVDGTVSNLTMSIYKAYLATVLMSSDFGEYLYTIATRVYAQYAIYESLAFAGDDYAYYYAYINGYTDENGDVVNAFKYGTFQQLVQYENQSLRPGAVPTYTFNYADVYRAIIDPEASDEDIEYSLYNGTNENTLLKWLSYATGKALDSTDGNSLLAWLLSVTGKAADELDAWFAENGLNGVNEGLGKILTPILNFLGITQPPSFGTVLEKLNSEYQKVYLAKRGCTDSYSDKDSAHYSYMLDVYWSIRQDLYNRRVSTPIYLDLYYDYLTGSGNRRNISSDVSIDATTTYIQHYTKYKVLLSLDKGKFLYDYIKMFVPNLVVTIRDGESVEDYLSEVNIGDMDVNVESVAYRLDTIFGNSAIYSKKFKDMFAHNYYSYSDILKTLLYTTESELGSVSAWNKILNMRSDLDSMLEELATVMDLTNGQKTASGSVHINYSDEVYGETYNYLSNLRDSLDTYIGIQNTLDQIEKASITFTLAQYANNYVESGFEFTIRNKQYTLDTSVSTMRLAEYVYGGAFLEQFGIYSQFTSPTFTGVVSTSKVIDSDGYAKTKLYSFEALREFASSLANYTGKLYFLTNLSDLSENVSDSLMLSEYIYSNSSYINNFMNTEGATYRTTPEYLLLDHIVGYEELLPDTLVGLIFGDTVDSLGRMGCADPYITLLAKYLENNIDFTASERALMDSMNIKADGIGGVISSLPDEFKVTALRRYLVYIQTTTSRAQIVDNSFNTQTELTGNDVDGFYGIYLPNGYTASGHYNAGGNTNTASDRIHVVFKKVISYLTISTEQEEERTSLGSEGEIVNLDGMNFKDLKTYLMSSLIDYEKNESETGAENSARYLTLFNLVSGEFDYYYATDNTLNFIGTTLSKVTKQMTDTSVLTDRVMYTPVDTTNAFDLYVSFEIDKSTRGTILKLCGIENRPIEELVNLEYDELYARDGSYDEANGDVFVVCSYDNDTGKYIPFMATNRKYSGSFSGSKYMDYMNDTGYRIYTSFYDSPTGNRFAYPIIAKGILTADQRPTAISVQNNIAKFYRSDITVTTSVGEDALQRTNTAVETTTIGYVKYVDVASFSNKAKTNESKTMFMGSSDIMTYIESDMDVYYIQYTNVYNVAKADEFDAISVLDSFSSFFGMSVQMHFMMILGFITLVPLLFRASGAVLKRVLDLIFLVLAGPLCISLNSLEYEEKKEHSGYSQWKNYMIQTLLSVFGLVIALNLYYIMVSTTMNMTFVSEGDTTMQKLAMIGGLSFVTASLLNAVIKFMFIIVATNMIEAAADMLTGMITGGKVDKALASPMSGTNAIDSIVSLKDQMLGDLKKGTHLLKDVVSGKILVEAKNALIETLPGSKIVSAAKDKVGGIRNYMKSRELYKKAREKGVSRTMATIAAREFRNNYKKQKQQQRQKRQQSAKNFYSKFGMNVG